VSNEVKIVQNLLTQQKRYDLSIKLDGAYFETRWLEEQNDVVCVTLELYVHPNNFLDLQKLLKEDKNILISHFSGFLDSSTFIGDLAIKIDKNIKLPIISDTIYIFVDESGDMDFSNKGSKHYMFTFLVKRRPFNLHEYISNYKYTLLERNLDPLNTNRLDIEAFHAGEDNKYIREEIFNIISTFDENSVKSYSYILEKPKVEPKKRYEKDKFYVDNLNLAIRKLLDKLDIDKNFVIVTDRLPVQKNKNKQVSALKKGIKEYIKNKNLNIRYDIFHHCSASSVNLQIVDYISWAIFRKYEWGKDIYYKQIEKYLIDIDLMTKDREVNHYEK
jgi:hypothetical protein